MFPPYSQRATSVFFDVSSQVSAQTVFKSFCLVLVNPGCLVPPDLGFSLIGAFR